MTAAGLQRFVEAQAPVWAQVRQELAEGRKRTHWIWFVFPQVAGLGRSPTALRFALASLEEARDYLAHPVLGPRLAEATDLMLGHRGVAADAVLGGIDAMKFRSSMTLFASADPDAPRFRAALDAFFDGEPDPLTLERLATSG